MRFLLFLLIASLVIQTQAQELKMKSLSCAEFAIPSSDSVKNEMSRAKKATLLSALLPGTGQIYNGKYWKTAIIYGGAAGLIYMYKTNLDSMRNYQQAYVYRLDDDSTTNDLIYSNLTDAAVKNYRDFHRRLKDISILGFFGLYAIQIIDANVDAHLYEFKVNKDLSMKVEPQIWPSNRYSSGYQGIKLSFYF
ncbi:MAG: hypothetical protein JXR19_01315 [Bacteroidia bacterium]